GSNLASTVGYGKFTKQTREMIKLPPYQKSVIIGLILSDGFLSLSSKGSKNARLEFEQSYSKKEYVFFVFFILSHYCNSLPGLFFTKKAGIRKENVNYSLKIVTRSILCFTELYSLFYLNKVKIIPDNIYDLLTPVALAHLIMGDGQIASNGLRICTDAYSSSDIVKLINVLMIKYRLVCTIHVLDDRQRIYISAKSINLLASIIKPYMIKSMYYKIKS
ncbi:LAGLIDADG endonuclease, partial [Tuber indicum]